MHRQKTGDRERVNTGRQRVWVPYHNILRNKRKTIIVRELFHILLLFLLLFYNVMKRHAVDVSPWAGAPSIITE